ncbi:MAG: MBL fold metallo-hydrolase [Treponema sp.]|nr:MBL fold metallo-hydrolase [Treponema sp.]
MKKGIKTVLITIIAIFVLIIGIGLFYYFPMFFMTPAETGQIPSTNIYVIKDFGNNVFLVNTGNGYIMFDTGLNAKNIENAIKEANINLNDIKWIFLSHSDGDHLSALTLFKNAEIYMSVNELPLLNGTMKRSILGGNSLPIGINIDRIIPLRHVQELIFNETRVKCILAQGHTNGSMLYLVDDQYLFTGDAFKLKNGNISVHPYTMDKNLSKRTIEELKETINNAHIVLTSHYGIHYNNRN